MKRMLILVIMALFVLWSGVSVAADDAVIDEIQAEVNNLKGGLPAEQAAREAVDAVLQSNIDALSNRVAAVEAYESLITDLESQLSTALDMIAELQVAVAALDPNGELVKLANHVMVDDSTINGLVGPHVIFYGANVHVQNGAGSTQTTNGSGNLLVGYNESGFADETNRNGSHNLIVGQDHEYTSHGGFVAGRMNKIYNVDSTVSGGQNNTAIGPYASISGGTYNTAGFEASVSGGSSNIANARWSSISGGQNNITGEPDNLTDSWYSSISGGSWNQALGARSSICGGSYNTANGPTSSVTGGYENEASGQYTSISGGIFNIADGDYSSVSGGGVNNAIGYGSSISGGQENTASGSGTSVSGGRLNEAYYQLSTVSGGISLTTTINYEHLP